MITPEIVLSILAALHALEIEYAGRGAAVECADARAVLMHRLQSLRIDREGFGPRPLAVAVTGLVIEGMHPCAELREALEMIRTRGGDWYFEAPSMLALDDGRGGVFEYEVLRPGASHATRTRGARIGSRPFAVPREPSRACVTCGGHAVGTDGIGRPSCAGCAAP